LGSNRLQDSGSDRDSVMDMRSILKMIQLWIWIWVGIVLKMMIGQRNTCSSEDMNRN